MLRRIFLMIVIATAWAGLGVESIHAQLDMVGGNTKTDRHIRSEILSLPYYGVFDAIGYTVNGDTVTLTGWVTRGVTKEAAEDAVEDISGVDKVVNKIELLPPSPSDDRIRRRALNALAGRGGSLMYYFLGTNPSIRIIVNGGRIRLEGYVNNRADADLANILARGVSGTFGVTNNLRVLNDTP